MDDFKRSHLLFAAGRSLHRRSLAIMNSVIQNFRMLLITALPVLVLAEAIRTACDQAQFGRISHTSRSTQTLHFDESEKGSELAKPRKSEEEPKF